MIALAGEILLDLLSPAARSWLAKIGQRRTYADGELIHSRGDGVSAMSVVIKGQVRLVRLQADGSHTFVSTVRAGQHFGDVLLLGRRKRTHDALAQGEVVIDHYDAAAFELILGNADVVRELYRVTALRLTGSMAMSDDLRSLPREVHLAKILLFLWRQNGEGQCIECTQEDLASLLGTSVMSLSKHLAKLKQLGLIETGYRRIRIVDPSKVTRWLRDQPIR